MIRRGARRVATIGAFGAVLLAGCAASDGATGWHREGASPAQTRAAWNDCRRLAEDELGAAGRLPAGGPISTGNDPLANYDTYAAGRDIRRLAADCMGQKGYRRVAD
ncbi:hypothetical protein [Roseospirillum parvum]|uniref:hypothetical protein n=1 Tax=Roseospirillum parvum TaxID=83401 RepID=UPI00116014DB|nr:hypothetical protein [Roseospirillum parvum]